MAEYIVNYMVFNDDETNNCQTNWGTMNLPKDAMEYASPDEYQKFLDDLLAGINASYEKQGKFHGWKSIWIGSIIPIRDAGD